MKAKEAKTDRWLEGYLCAVAKAIELEGSANTHEQELFRMAGPVESVIACAHPVDLRTFVQAGLIDGNNEAVKAKIKDLPT